MKKQELIEHIEDLPYKEGPIVDKIDISRKGLLELVKQLDEPEKPVVPQFVADVIEGVREENLELEDALHCTWGKGTKEFTEWYKKKSNRDILARAYLDGYEVEKEKLYRVKMKGNIEADKLVYGNFVEKYFFAQKPSLPSVRNYHTKKQLEKAGFGEVFNSPLFEVEEVTE